MTDLINGIQSVCSSLTHLGKNFPHINNLDSDNDQIIHLIVNISQHQIIKMHLE